MLDGARLSWSGLGLSGMRLNSQFSLPRAHPISRGDVAGGGSHTPAQSRRAIAQAIERSTMTIPL